MAAIKRSVSFRPEIWAEVERLAARENAGVSGIVNAALERYIRIQEGLEAVREWEAEHGAFTPEEVAEADRLLDEAGVGLPRASDARPDIR